MSPSASASKNLGVRHDIADAIEPIERAEAKKRMLAGKPLGNFPKGRAADKVGRIVGKDRKTIAKAR